MVARLISQSAPVRYFMKKDHLITFSREDFISDIRDTLAKIRHRDFPVLGRDGKYCGMLSRRSLLNMDNKKIILVDHNEKGQAVDGIDEAEVLEIIDHHRLGSMETALPVFFRNQPVQVRLFMNCIRKITWKWIRKSQGCFAPQSFPIR